MNISPISQQFKLNLNKKQNKCRTTTLKNDVFIKNTNAISFCAGKINPKYSALSSDMTKYIMNSSTITEAEIEKIIQKYSPTTTFERMENLQTSHRITQGSTGYTKIPIQFAFDENGNIKIETAPKTVYTYIPENLDKRERIILLDRILHECTHVLQEESKDRISGQEFFNSHIKNSKNLQATIETLSKLPNIFVSLEEISMRVLRESNEVFDSLPTKLKNTNLTYDKLCMCTQGAKATEFLSEALCFLLNKHNVGDINLALDFISYKAQIEYEAYSNALQGNKTQLNLNGKTDFDIRLEMYTKIIEAVKKLKGIKKF